MLIISAFSYSAFFPLMLSVLLSVSVTVNYLTHPTTSFSPLHHNFHTHSTHLFYCLSVTLQKFNYLRNKKKERKIYFHLCLSGFVKSKQTLKKTYYDQYVCSIPHCYIVFKCNIFGTITKLVSNNKDKTLVLQDTHSLILPELYCFNIITASKVIILQSRQTGSTNKEMGFFSKGNVHMDAIVDRRAFAPGSKIPLQA